MPIIKTPAESRYVGIDPGKGGGIAIIIGRDVECFVMPVSTLDLWKCIDRLECVRHAYIEQVHSMPRDGVRSAFTFGEGYGRLQMALTAAGIPYSLISPQGWMKELGIPPRAKEEPKNLLKERLRATAQRLYPKTPIWDGTLGRQRAVCDAILIAEYGRRLHTGELKCRKSPRPRRDR